jgi:uncharacterized protein (DUF433 family)
MAAQRHRQNGARDARIVKLREQGITVQQLAERFDLKPRDITQIVYRSSQRDRQAENDFLGETI